MNTQQQEAQALSQTQAQQNGSSGESAITSLALVIPVYNEVDNVDLLHGEIRAMLDTLPEISPQVIYVNDGSKDGSVEKLEALAASYPEVVLSLIHI
ncbi:MAG: glycosyltransferase, partial [Chloroflexi bacterium]|nr:glycosyltransferase [Chloroflexota bacterium]